MYRINLYPHGLERRAQRASGLRRSAGLALLAGAQLVLLGFFALTGWTVKAQADSAEARLAGLRERLTPVGNSGARAAVNQARLLMERRAGRCVWSPVINEIRGALPRDLIFERFEATAPAGNQDVFTGLLLHGRLRAGTNVDPVVDYINRLSASPVYRAQFSAGKLDRVDNTQEVARFVIACPLIRPASADSVAEGNGG